MCTQPHFEKYLEEQGDIIDNLSYQLAVAFCRADDSRPDEDVLPWDMGIIGSINEAVQEILNEHGLPTCWPYRENDVPCYSTDSCNAIICPYKETKDQKEERKDIK